MTGKADFSLEIPVDHKTGFKPLPDLVAFDLCRAYAVTGGNLLLHNTRNGKRALVRPDVYQALVKCNAFQSIDGHTDNLLKQEPAGKSRRQDVSGVLQQMLKAGILCSTREVMERIKLPAGTGRQEARDAPPVAAIITWERPEALKRLLVSMVDNCDTGKLQCLYVIDDSRSRENQEKNQAVADEFAPRFSSPLHYFGRAEQRGLIEALVKKIPHHEDAVRFLIDPDMWVEQWTAGLSRNLATFLSVGHRLVVMDDDVICDVYDPPGLRPGITFSDSPRENDFFASADEWADWRQAINPDPIDRHMQVLGLTLAEAVAILGHQNLSPQGFKNTTSLLASELQPDSPVLLTECGSLGCPGTNNNTWLPSMADGSLKKMLASQRKTSNALTHRKVWSGRSNPHFAQHSNMSQVTGLDNRQLLPPYLPILRGQDLLFGYMLDYMFPASVIFDYPWAVPHLPIPERSWGLKDLNFTPRASFPMFFFNKVPEQKIQCQSSDPSDRLSWLAAWLRDLAGAPSDRLIAMQLHSSLEAGTEKLRHMEELLANAQSAPVDWQNYLRNGVAQMNAGLDAISRGDVPVKGIQGEMEGEELIAFWRRTWKGFASACEAWPEIRRAAEAVVRDGARAG